MSGLRYIPPARAIFDSTIYPGGLLHVFEPGTSNRVSLYADVDLSVPISNPVIADVAGFFQAVYVDPTSEYDVQITDGIGNVIIEEEYFIPLNSPLSLVDHDPRSASGAPLPLAQYTFYLASTTILADVFADEGLSVPLDNPVVADSSGHFPQIWLDPINPARVLLHDASGVLIFDVEQYRFNTEILPPSPPVLSGEYDAPVNALSWTASVSQFGAIAGYRLYRSEDNGPFVEIVDQPGLTYDDGDVAEGHTYSYYVVGYDTDENDSAPSNIVSLSINVAIEIITSSRTWVRPGDLLSMQVIVIGGGGGGGSGEVQIANTNGVGNAGGGGGGGGVSIAALNATDVTPTVEVAIGTGGAGGASRISAGDGNSGAAGGETSFGSYLAAPGGGGGTKGSNGGGGNAGVGGIGTTATGGAGGLGGGFISGDGVNRAPTAGSGTSEAGAGGGGGQASGQNAGIGGNSPGAGGTSTNYGGDGGDGGAGGAINGTHGDPGGEYGGGGGGGGGAGGFAGSSGVASGAGGDGHSGVCVLIYTYIP